MLVFFFKKKERESNSRDSNESVIDFSHLPSLMQKLQLELLSLATAALARCKHEPAAVDSCERLQFCFMILAAFLRILSRSICNVVRYVAQCCLSLDTRVGLLVPCGIINTPGMLCMFFPLFYSRPAIPFLLLIFWNSTRMKLKIS